MVCGRASRERHVAHANSVNPKNGKPAGMIAQDVYEIVMANAEQLDSAIVYDRDFNYN